MSIDHLIAELAAVQCGVFARFQIIDLGGDASYIKRRLRSGRWLLVAPGVYALPGLPLGRQRRLWIAYLAAGANAVVSHQSAGRDFGVPGFSADDLHLTVPHPEHQRVEGATVHQTRYLPRHHWIYLNGRRTTTLARTLVDLAPWLSKPVLDRAYQHAIVTEHLTHAKMSRCFLELINPGRRGLEKLGAILDERGPGFVAPVSVLEERLFEVVASTGLPAPIRQFPLPGRQMVKGCVDTAFVEAMLILEGDGRRWHSRVDDFARDRARDKEAARAGWQTLRFCYEELVGDPVDCADTILETYNLRVALLRRSS